MLFSKLNLFLLIVLGSILQEVIDVRADSTLKPLNVQDLFNLRAKQSEREARSIRNGATCGYTSCPLEDPNKINVHIVAHTHDDVGWLKTVDQYYYGTRKHDSMVGVQYILDSIIPELVIDSSKRFVYVEMSFFVKWWQEQDESTKEIVHRLVDEGRLEFLNGGWCMNDEATVTYQSMIEQMTLGLKFLNETFGPCGRPKVGWQIDPFGHTNEQASLFAQFGFDGMYFTRESFEDKSMRTASKSLDLLWHGDSVLNGQSGSIFTSIFRDGYDAPNGFCFDVFCLDDNLVDNKKSHAYNIDYKGNAFINYLRTYAKSRLTNQILIPMGGDFQYSAAGQNFKNLDKLMRYVRVTAPDLNIFYSTPSCYQLAIHKQIVDEQRSLKLPEKYDDFMPYDSTSSVWWSGYFTSRPSIKLVERETANLMQVTRVISLANLLKPQNNKRWIEDVRDHENRCLMPLWEILGDLQHHDAVTGTEKQHVNEDYLRRASEAAALCAKFIGDLRRAKLNEYLKRSPRYEQFKESGKRFKLDAAYLEDTSFCPRLNISQCDPIESDVDPKRYVLNSTQKLPFSKVPPELETKAILLNVYNPLARPINQHDIRLPCNGRCDLDKIRVVHLSTNDAMKLIRLPLPSGIATLPFRDAITNYEILFYANIPPLGYTSFLIEDTNNEEIVDEESEPSDSIVVNDEVSVDTSRSRTRRIRHASQEDGQYEYFSLNLGASSDMEEEEVEKNNERVRRESTPQNTQERVIIKFDISSGMIMGLRRASDGSFFNLTQRFGYYFPANNLAQPGAYIFRPNTSEPYMFEKPFVYKMFKRKNGALIEIHQKWADWLWQTIRVDAKKNYIEFDYVVGPIPIEDQRIGREVVSRYITNMSNNGVFMTDSNGRQLLPRHRLRTREPEQTGGSFYPVVSTIMLRNTGNSSRSGAKSSGAIAILVDRSQAGTSLNEGQLELLIHRRQMKDDNFGVGEPLNEPGEDGRGLVVRGKHRLYVKFQDQDTREKAVKKQTPQLFRLNDVPIGNLSYERHFYNHKTDREGLEVGSESTYIAYDPVYNDLRQEALRHAMKPVLTFDRLRVTANEFAEMVASDNNVKVKTDLSLLNTSLPINVHLLTLQPWTSKPNEILIRLENLDNPLTIHPYPNYGVYQNLLSTYKATSDYFNINDETNESCTDLSRLKTEVDIEYLIKKIRIIALEELNLGANGKLKDEKRLDWRGEKFTYNNCDSSMSIKATVVKLGPRQIRTFLARFEFL